MSNTKPNGVLYPFAGIITLSLSTSIMYYILICKGDELNVMGWFFVTEHNTHVGCLILYGMLALSFVLGASLFIYCIRGLIQISREDDSDSYLVCNCCGSYLENAVDIRMASRANSEK